MKKKNIGTKEKIVADVVGAAAGKAIKAMTESELLEAIASSGTRIATEKLLTAVKNAKPEELVGMAILATGVVIYAPAMLLARFFGVDEPQSDDSDHRDVHMGPYTLEEMGF
jgi:hypothetical protein